LYTTHNVHFDKHPQVQLVTLNLLGKSILFDESSDSWRQRRKAMSPAFYKGKLAGLVSIARSEVDDKVERFKKLYEQNGGPVKINMIAEISTLMTRILISCTVGSEVNEMKVDYWESG
jgi:cytochrome P450